MVDNQIKEQDKQPIAEIENLVSAEKVPENNKDNKTMTIKWGMAEELMQMGISLNSARRILNIPDSYHLSSVQPGKQEGESNRRIIKSRETSEHKQQRPFLKIHQISEGMLVSQHQLGVGLVTTVGDRRQGVVTVLFGHHGSKKLVVNCAKLQPGRKLS